METAFKIFLLLTGISSVAFLVFVISYVYRRVRNYKVKQIYMGISLACLLFFGSITGFMYYKLFIDIPKQQNTMEYITLDDVITYAVNGKSVTGDGQMGHMVFTGKFNEKGIDYYVFQGTKGMLIATAIEITPMINELKVGRVYTLYCKVNKVTMDGNNKVVVWGEIK